MPNISSDITRPSPAARPAATTPPREWDPGYGAESSNTEDTEALESDEAADEPAPEPETEDEEEGTAPDEAEGDDEGGDTEDVPPPAETPRAKNRIQQLANQNRELREAMKQQAEINRQLQETLARNAALQERALSYSDQYQQQRQQQATEAQLEAQVRAAGWDPTDRRDQAAIMALKKMIDLEAKNRELETRMERQQQEAAEKMYHSTMESALQTQLTGYEVTPQQIQNLRKIAYAHARAEQIADPNLAVAAVIEAILPSLRKKAAARPAPKAPVDPQERAALAAVAMSGRTSGRSAGSHASGRPPKNPNASPEDLLFGARKGGGFGP